jgi:glycine/D-amino acid oxidase-like deaminating enzyme
VAGLRRRHHAGGLGRDDHDEQIPSIAGLYVMLGDSGTSFKTAPAIGRGLSEWIVQGKPRTVDLSPFRSTRFAEGRPWLDEHHYGRERTLSVSR